MKQIIALLLGCLFLFAGCSPNKSIPTETQTQAKLTADYFLIESTSENIVCIQIPYVAELAGPRFSFVEAYVIERVQGFCEVTFNLSPSKTALSVDEGKYDQYGVDIKANVTFCSDELVSIVFEGYINQKDAAHPSYVLFALNFDPDTHKKILLSDRYCIDNKKVYQAFAEQATTNLFKDTDGVWPEGLGTFAEEFCSEEMFIENLENPNEIQWYFTETGIGISYTVPFSMGGHQEVVLPYTVLGK